MLVWLVGNTWWSSRSSDISTTRPTLDAYSASYHI